MCELYCISFIEYMLAGKTYIIQIYFFRVTINDKIIYKQFRDKYVKSKIWTKKVDEKKYYLLDEIKHNDLKS